MIMENLVFACIQPQKHFLEIFLQSVIHKLIQGFMEGMVIKMVVVWEKKVVRKLRTCKDQGGGKFSSNSDKWTKAMMESTGSDSGIIIL